MTAESPSAGPLAALLERSEEQGCVNLSELSELAQSLELGDDEAQMIQEEIDARGLDLSDDCGRSGVAETTYVNGGLAGTTTDALQLFLNEIRRYPLLTAA